MAEAMRPATSNIIHILQAAPSSYANDGDGKHMSMKSGVPPVASRAEVASSWNDTRHKLLFTSRASSSFGPTYTARTLARVADRSTAFIG